ncbi:PD-(D/E)XK nuclease family protein [Ruminococcaceae bacterium OttesenSCG-928-I18]|nr:PD-(D/E)XK nuclease family protein [Ruminococcaceae bacterium OttesenSCG-928-I18]
MLQLVLGIAGTGKTTWIIEQLKARAKEGKASILLVPEQFSQAAETLALETLGDAGSAFVEVVSFRTLAERILRSTGGENLHVLSEAGRAVFVRRALSSVSEGLRTFRRGKKDTAFCNLCAQTLTELKTAGATPGSLRTIAEHSGDGKLGDIALIFEAYEAAIAKSALDPDDRLLLAAEGAGPAFFSEKACYIDNFDGFTSPEYKLIDTLLRGCTSVNITLCCDSLQETEGGLGLFSPVRATAQRLLARARKAGLPTPAPVLLPLPRRSNVDALQAVNLLFAGRVPSAVSSTEKLTLTEAEDRHAEVKTVAAQMRQLALAGVPFSKMALICRDVALYESAVRREFGLYDIPWFSDLPDSIEYSSPISFLRAALALLRQGLSSGPLLALLKSGLCGFTQRELSALDNYVFTWQPRSADWRAPFTKHPMGLLQELDEDAEATLALAEGVRARVVPPLEDFLRGAKGRGAAALSIALYRLLDRFGAPEHLEENAAALEQNGDFPFAERSRRAWDLSMEMLDQMAFILGEEKVSYEEYDELFLLLVRSTDFGQAPSTLESVIFTSADRMRLADPDYCFVVGLCEGEFPMKVGYSGLLTHADRDLLVENGIEMPGSFQNRVLLEQMFLYRALTSPRLGLHLSWPARHGGMPTSVSSSLLPLSRLLQPGPLSLEGEALAGTPQAAFAQLAPVYRQHTVQAATLQAALSQSGSPFAMQALPLLQGVDNRADFSVDSPASLHKLTGEVLQVSPTRAERYFNCRFSFLLEHILRVRPRRQAKLSPLESGTFVHYILEHVLREAKGRFSEQDDDNLHLLTKRFADEFIEANFPDLSPRTSLLLHRITDTSYELLRYLRNWARHSAFEIDALELGIGEGPLAPLVLKGEQGQTLRVVGKIDRVDLLRKGDKTYLCVLDYKTGSKKFDLEEVLYGLNTQMLVYMDALCRQAKGPYAGAIPAGMLYLSSDPAPKSGERSEEDVPLFQLDGLLLDDPAVLQALDSDQSGLFLPVKYKSDGSLRPSKHLADLQRIGGLSLYIENLFTEMAAEVSKGSFAARPLTKTSGERPCDFCPYRACCRHEDGRDERILSKEQGALEKIEALGGKEEVPHGSS